MKSSLAGAAALVLAAAVFGPAAAQTVSAPAPAAATAPAAQAKFSTQTKLGVLAADPAAMAVLQKHIPQVVAHPQFPDAAEMTLPDIVQYVPELTPDLLKQIDEDLAKLS